MNEVQAFGREFTACWQRLPNKSFFFALLAAWLVLFQFLGNSTFGYYDSTSLVAWMYHAYTSPVTDDGHGSLIPWVVLGLFWWKREKLLAQPIQIWWPGLVMVGLALGLHVFGFVAQQARISIVALFVGIYGLMGLAWGRDWLRASFFPFFLLSFCVPFGSLGEAITVPLRILATAVSAGIAHGFGIDVIHEGTQIFDAQRSFNYDVAPACSGIRSLVALVTLSIIYGFIYFRSGWKRLALVVAAFPLAVAGNVFRLTVIIVTAEVFGQEAGNFVHENALLSLLPYVPAIGGLLVLVRWLGKSEPKRV